MTILRPDEHDGGDEDSTQWGDEYMKAIIVNGIAALMDKPLDPAATTQLFVDSMIGSIQASGRYEVTRHRLEPGGILIVNYIDRGPVHFATQVGS